MVDSCICCFWAMEKLAAGEKQIPNFETETDNWLIDSCVDNQSGLEELAVTQEESQPALQGERHWFVMRDLTRPNAKFPAYRRLKEEGVECFTPLEWRIVTRHGKRVREQMPVLHDLLFAHGTRAAIDPIVNRFPTFQYRYVRGAYCEPMTVRDADMERFISAVRATDNPVYFRPGELAPAMCGRRVRIVGGPLDGYEGRLLSIRGSRVRRLVVELPSLLFVAVEVQPEYIQLL